MSCLSRIEIILFFNILNEKTTFPIFLNRLSSCLYLSVNKFFQNTKDLVVIFCNCDQIPWPRKLEEQKFIWAYDSRGMRLSWWGDMTARRRYRVRNMKLRAYSFKCKHEAETVKRKGQGGFLSLLPVAYFYWQNYISPKPHQIVP